MNPEIKTVENTFFPWMHDIVYKAFLKQECKNEEPDAWKAYWIDHKGKCIYSYTACIFVKTKAGHYWYIDLYYYAYEERLNTHTRGPFVSLESMKADYDESPLEGLAFPDDLNKMKANPPKRINIQERLGELKKQLWHDIANQDSYYVYEDKDGNVYNEEGYYLETLILD